MKVADEAERERRPGGISHGRLCLDFVAATRGLGLAGEGSKQDLSRWVLENRMTGRLAPVGTSTLQEAIALREAVQACVLAAIEGQEFPEAGRARINRWAMMPAYPQLEQTGELTWHAPRPVEGALTRVARDAVELLSGELLSRIRQCPGPGCGALFLDRSSSGRARWCSMATCGNRAKVAGYRGRRRAARGSPPRARGG